MKTMTEMMREFHTKGGHYQRAIPDLRLDVPDNVKLLRARLMIEELGELVSAMHEGDQVEVADGLADLVYVAVGTAISYGLDIEQLFAEVHRSNMTKDFHVGGDVGSKYGGVCVKGERYEPPQIEKLLRAAAGE